MLSGGYTCNELRKTARRSGRGGAEDGERVKKEGRGEKRQDRCFLRKMEKRMGRKKLVKDV